jgi:hypothetical protein
MRTRQIPRAEWFNFFEGLTRQQSGWPVTVWLLGPSIGAQIEARDLPFEGIVADPLARSIAIHLGVMPGKNVEHPIPTPISVWLETTEESTPAALGINSTDGTTTLLEFRCPIPPKLEHGVAPLKSLPLHVH